MNTCLFGLIVIHQFLGLLRDVNAGALAPLKCGLGWKPCKDGIECVSYKHVCDGETDCRDGSDEEDCAVGCNTDQFQCAHGKKCIDQSEVCDGVAQCQDRSDEADCKAHMGDCDHRCDNKTRCLPVSFLCDGERDCLDRTDEANCDSDDHFKKSAPPAALYCRAGSKFCNDKTECVLYNHVCDGDADCTDGSDEEGCPSTCENGQFKCAHGKKCISHRQVCDGVAQCQDRSDEAECMAHMEDCFHRCDNKTRCFPVTFLCDGERDCLDETDEDNCADLRCNGGEFRCASGQCVSVSMLCDGHPDCKDRSDEESCTKLPKCSTSRVCPHSKECLVEEWICDGYKDCKDGTDEKDCKLVTMECGEFQWSCNSKTHCVPKFWRCDGTKDCDDGSDETGCGVPPCLPHQFQCGSMECLDVALVCNGMTNCADGSDEGGDCKTKCPLPAAAHCSQDCHSTPKGTRCWCQSGYNLQDDGVSCVDVDECKHRNPGVCSQLCTNTEGSYKCLCNAGYLLEADGRSCKITGEPFLLASVKTELFLFGLLSGSLDILLSSAKKAILSVDYDWREQKVFWVSLDSESIRWSSLDQKSKGTLISGVKSDCIAVDWVGRNLYWIDGIGNQIIAIRLTTAVTNALDYSVILDEDFEQPRSLALLPQKGIMFWSEIGIEPKIERAGMDGSERKVVVSHNLSWPGGVAVDTLGERVYWTDERLKCIGSATLEGEDVRILQMKETSNPFSLTVFNDMLYWSDAKRRTIQGTQKLTGKGHQVLFKRPGQPFGLKVIHPQLQARIESPCEKLRCSHLCVLAPGPKAVCKCPSGLLLAGDGLTCSNLVTSAFLLLLSRLTVTQIYLQAMHSAVSLKGWPEHLALPLPSMNEVAMLDYSLRDQTLYLADAGQASVGLFKLKETGLLPRGQLLRLLGDVMTSMALDWVTLSVYWSSIKQPRLQVTSASGMHTAVLIRDDIGSLESIALHPLRGRVCFINLLRQEGGGALPRVECSHMDGSRRVLVWEKAKQPTGLVFSNSGNEIYWADISSGVIASIGVDGSGFKEFQTGDGLTAFALSDEMLLWMTVNDTAKLWYRDKRQVQKLWFEVNTGVLSMRAYSESSQTGSNLCTVDNGDCPHLCLATPGGRTCVCAHDHLSVGASCVPDQLCQAGSRSCLDGSICLPLQQFCDGHVDCSDHSDENCVHLKAKPVTKTTPQQDVSLTPPSSSLPSNTSADQKGRGNQDLMRDLNGECDEAGNCECSLGYSGEACQDLLIQGPLLYGAVAAGAGLVALVVLAAVIVKRHKASRRNSLLVKDTSMTDLEKPPETPVETVSSQSQPKETDFTEEVVPSE